jgi:hypothetical protein
MFGVSQRVLMGASGGAGDGGPLEITVNAVNFDGTNDYLTRGADFTSNIDGPRGTLVFWLDMNGGDGAVHNIMIGEGSFFNLTRRNDNKMQINLWSATPANILDMLSINTRVAADGWVCVLMSWDLTSALKAHLFFNDVDETSIATKIEGDIDYTRANYAIGASITGGAKLNGCLSQFYFNAEEYLDFTVESNRRKFISAGGKPVDLGADGSGPTGSVPILFLSGPTDSWHTNDGDGGGMTEVGALTDCANSPSD